MTHRGRLPVLRLILLLFLASPVIASAQMVRGVVTDAASGAAVKAVDISLFSVDKQPLGRTASDENGRFEIVLPKGKTVYLQAARIGYETVKSEPITASTREMLQLTVRLSAVPIPLQGVEVVTRREADARLQPFLDRASMYKRIGIGRIWTRAELEQRHPALVSHVINYWIPHRTEFNCSGTAIFLDDIPIDAADVDLLVGADQLEGVEIYDDLQIPQDLLMHSLSVRTGAPTQEVVTEEGGDLVVPRCKTVMLWRKPYHELNAVQRPHVSTLRHVLGASLLATIVLLEQILW